MHEDRGLQAKQTADAKSLEQEWLPQSESSRTPRRLDTWAGARPRGAL